MSRIASSEHLKETGYIIEDASGQASGSEASCTSSLVIFSNTRLTHDFNPDALLRLTDIP